MPRCPDCAKFVEVNAEVDPEVEVEVDNVDGNGKVTGSVMISNECADCSTQLKSASFDVDLEVEVKHAEGCAKDDDLELEFGVERFDEFVPPGAKRQKHMYGASGTAIVKCPCGGEGSADWRDSIQSSHMDD